MIDVLTLIITIIISISLLITSIYILAYFCHPDDTSSFDGWVLKIVVVFGIILSWSQVLALPLDVSNNRGFGNGLDMHLFWCIIYYADFIYVFIIYPLSVSYYECDSEWTFCEKLKHSLCFFILTLIIFITIVVTLYILFGKAEVPITAYEINLSDFNISSETFITEQVINMTQNYTEVKETNLELNVSLLIYAVGLLTFVSWFIFAFFGGIGLAAVPLDFFFDFCTRPKLIRSAEVKERRSNLLRHIENLRALGEELKVMVKNGADREWIFSGRRRKYKRKLHEFRAGCYVADEEFYVVNASEEIRVKNNCYVVLYYLLIPLGIITSVLSLLWMSQFICSYIYTSKGRAGYPLISNLLLYLQDNYMAFLSFFIFTVLCLYLLYCLMKGNFKFGVRIFCCWTIHPMKKNNTYMNSFLFNICLILIGSFSITHFCSNCLSDYITFTDIDLIFNVQIKYLKFFNYFYQYNAFEYAFFGISFLSLVFLLCRPSDRTDVVVESKPDLEMKLLNKKYVRREE